MIDIDSLLNPISAESPSGEDISYSTEYDAIQDARRSDDPSLDQGEWVTALKSADWPSVSRQCEKLLKERSKDLRLAAWLADARTRLDGFSGLADGYRLVARLCDRYWDTLYPEADAGDQELRIGTLSWLLTQSMQWVRTIPLLDSPQGRFNAIGLEAALRPRSTSEGAHENRPDSTQVEVVRAGTPFDFYRRLAEEAPASLDALRELEIAVDARLGMEGPSFSAVRDAVTDVVTTALRFASAAGVPVDGVMPPLSMQGVETTSTGISAPPAPINNANSGEVTSRKEAIVQLRRVADFFRRTEPHSPVAYLADKAARWGTMPLHVWLKSVVKDGAALSQLEELLDVGTNEPHNE